MNILARGGWQQRIRLFAGLVLFVFVAFHLLNHAVGVFGLDELEMVQTWRVTVTRHPVFAILLFSAAFLHVALGIWKTAQRRTWRIKPWEAIQIVSGFSVPFLIAPHVTGSRIAHEFFGVNDAYQYILYQIWPAHAVLQTSLVLVAWLHGCLGIHYWLRLNSTYSRFFPLVLTAMVALPVASLAGFVAGGRAAQFTVFDDESFQELADKVNWPSDANIATLAFTEDMIRYVSLGVVLAILGYYLACYIVQQMRPRVLVSYNGGPEVRAFRGATLLETSRLFGVPHASVCGGRARCSTCRVLIEAGHQDVQPPGPAEAETLQSISAPPQVRLACQIRPQAPITVSRLIAPKVRAREVAETAGKELDTTGVERSLAVMFMDVRGFTSLSEDRLPYDVVYLLNEIFSASGSAIETHGGWIDKYLGDGLMAVFGRDTGTSQGCRQALAAARDIDLTLDAVNTRFAEELPQPVRIGIGLHVGPLVLGEIGHVGSAAMTVIGRTVNTAARLEALTKTFGCQLVASHNLAHRAGLVLDGHRLEETEIRGLSDAIEIVAIDKARDIKFGD